MNPSSDHAKPTFAIPGTRVLLIALGLGIAIALSVLAVLANAALLAMAACA